MNLQEAVSELVDIILEADPIEWGLLPVDEADAKNLIILSMIEHWETIKTQENPEISMLAIASKLALENFALHLELRSK